MSSKASNILTKVKYKNLNGKVLFHRNLRGAHIVVGIPCSNLDAMVLNNMKSKPCDDEKGVLYKHTELTALFYAMYGELESKLKVPAQTKSSSLHDVYCSYVNNYFNLVFVTTNGTGSAVKKILSESLKLLNPAKLWKGYDLILRGMGLKTSKEEFRWCVNQVNGCLKKELIVLVVGKVNYGKTGSARTTKFKQTLEITHKKLKTDKQFRDTKPESLKNPVYKIPSDLNAVTVSGMSGYYLQKYLGFVSKNSINTQLSGNKLIIYTPRYNWVKNEFKKSGPMMNYVKQRFGKKSVLPALTGLLLEDAFVSGVVDAKTLSSFADKNLKPGDIQQGIKSLKL